MHRSIVAVDVGDSLQGALDDLFGFLPELLAFVVILVIGFVVAKIIAAIVRKVLEKMGVDRHVQSSSAQRYIEGVLPGASPSNGISRVVFWLVFVFFLFSAIGALKIPSLTTFMNQVMAYLPNIIVAIAIFVIAVIVASAVAAAITRIMGDTPTGKVAASVLPALVMVIALFMVLNQLKIAEEIVTIAFAATMGALALGLALAFGLGGRPVAQRLLEDAYAAGQRNKEQMKQDAAVGRERARQEAEHASRAGDTATHTRPASPGTTQPGTTTPSGSTS